MSASSQSKRVIVALDTPSLFRAESWIKELKGLVRFYKVGFELFTAHGWKAVERIKRLGASVFLDLKLHDIPNTAAKTAEVIMDHGVDIFNVHASGGFEMMKAVREAVDHRGKKSRKKPLILAVTVLTSLDQAALSKELGIKRTVEDQVLGLAALAKRAGLDGVVSSPRELGVLRQKFPRNFVLLTPGIRLASDKRGDQKRILEPKTAFQKGADFIVIGRPITASPKPAEAARLILQSL